MSRGVVRVEAFIRPQGLAKTLGSLQSFVFARSAPRIGGLGGQAQFPLLSISPQSRISAIFVTNANTANLFEKGDCHL